MFSLAYKTFGDSSKQGKERVYFTCHPADFEPCFSPIVADIHRLHNCAVYYNPEPATALPEAERQELLGSMRLLVIPVTTRFLLEPNPAMDVDLPFAIEHNIPVLPLMQEPGLGAIFNKKCGGLQYLDKNAQDITAVSFEKKFSDFLNSILLSDELMQKIRNSFDAYIFLSYRKKDRRDANQLIRSIHSNPRYRDIAIWYDEYLAVGREFKASIDTAMKKSRLFVLLVTQNLLEPGNYVLEHEYKDNLKLAEPLPILPVQMADADLVQMYIQYESLPEIVDGRNPDALEKALQAQLTGIANPENDSDPLHNYYIGLAYLGGVDVEVDHARALELITAAAEAGLLDAMKKLSSMYRNGDGVTADLSLCAHWLEQATECRRKEYEAWMAKPHRYDIEDKLSISSAKIYLNQCHHLAVTFQQLYRPDAVKKVCLQMLSFCESCPFSLHDYASFAYRNLGDIERYEGRLGRAQIYYQKSLEVTEAKLQASGSNEAKEELADNYTAFAKLAKEWGDSPLAEQYYQKALPLLEALAQDMHTERAYLDAADCCDALGDIQEDFSPAMAYYNQGLALRQQAAADSGSEAARLDLAKSYDALGSAALKQELDQLAQERFDEALSIRERLVQETRSDAARLSLSDSYRHFASLASYRGDLPSYQKYLQKCVSLYEQLYQNRNAITFYEQIILIVIYKMAASIPQPQIKKDYTQATEYLEKAQAICEALVQETDSIQAKQELADIYILRSDIAKKQDKLSPAMDYMEKCLLLREELLPETESAAQLDKICEMYRKLNQLCKAQGLEDRGWEYGEKLFAFEDTLATDADTPKARLRRAKAYSKLGGYALAEEKLPLARYHYKQVLKLLTPEESAVEALELLSDTCRQLAKLAEDQSNSPLAHSYLLQQLAADEKLFSQDTLWERLPAICYQLGSRAWEAGDFSQAQHYYMRCVAACQIHTTYSWEIRQALAESQLRLARLAQEQGDLPAALGYLEACHIYWEYSSFRDSKSILSDIYTRLGDICEKMADTDMCRCCRAIVAAIAADSGIAEAYYGLFQLYTARGDAAMAAAEPSEALRFFDRATKLVGSMPAKDTDSQMVQLYQSLYRQGLAAQALGDIPAAQALYRRILPSKILFLPRFYDIYGPVYQQLALIAPDRAFFKDAIAMWKVFCRRNPKDKDSRRLLKLLRQLHRQCRLTKRKP